MLELSSILAKYPQVLVFNKDNYKTAPEGLLEFYQKTSMSGDKFDLTYLREPTFFDFIFCHSDDFLVFVGTNNKHQITGIASMIFRPGYINGKLTRVCYLADLRLSFDRETLRLWRPLMSKLLLQSLDIKEIATDYFYTAVIDSNKQAQRALISSKNNGFIYDELSAYQMVNILKPFPWYKKQFSQFHVRRGKSDDLDQLRRFLDNKNIPFGYQFTQDQMNERFKNWNNFSVKNFYLCFENETLIGCLAPWASQCKKNKVLRVPFYFNFLKFFFNLPQAGENLNVLYLTHLTFSPLLSATNKREVFKSLLSGFYQHHESINEYHMVSFCDFEGLGLNQSIKAQFISSSIPMKLFTVRHKNKPEIALNQSDSYGFEMALV